MSAHNAATTEMLEAVVDGTVPVAKSTAADTASTAGTASALSTNAGSDTRPVYFQNGVPVQCGNELNVNISGTAAAATNAVNATNDGNGQNISATYSKVADVQTTLQQLQNGTIVVGQATNATNATYATSAGSAATAETASRATADGNGNNIVDTYALKSEVGEQTKLYAVEISTPGNTAAQNWLRATLYIRSQTQIATMQDVFNFLSDLRTKLPWTVEAYPFYPIVGVCMNNPCTGVSISDTGDTLYIYYPFSSKPYAISQLETPQIIEL